MSKIKTREKTKDIKVPDRSAIIGQRMKSAFIRSKKNAEALMDDRQATPNEYAADRTGLAADDLAHDAANVAASGTKTAVRQGRKLLQCQREKWAAEKRQENTAPAEQPHSPGPAQGSAPDRHTPQRSGGTVPERQRLPQHKCMMEHPPTQAGIERPTDTTISYVERGRAFAKKQAEWNQQVKNQTVPPDWTPHIKSPDAVQASRQKELPVKTAKQPAQAMGQAAKNTIKRAQRTIKTAQHTAKTAPRTAKTAINTADHTATAARKTAQAATKTARATAQDARVTAKSAAAAAKTTAKGASAAAKALLVSV